MAVRWHEVTADNFGIGRTVYRKGLSGFCAQDVLSTEIRGRLDLPMPLMSCRLGPSLTAVVHARWPVTSSTARKWNGKYRGISTIDRIVSAGGAAMVTGEGMAGC